MPWPPAPGTTVLRPRIPHSLRVVALSSVTVRVPAKVNLQLSVGAARPDGFHELATVYQAVGLFDEIVVRPADRPGITLTLSGEGEGELPLDSDNLAYRAVVALAEHVGMDPAVEVHIHKAIPIAGGMAGGSADAAGTLLACDALWRQATPRDELMALAAELGSDVPFSLHGGTAIGTGRGEQPDARPLARHLPLGLRAGRGGPVDACRLLGVRPAAGQSQGAGPVRVRHADAGRASRRPGAPGQVAAQRPAAGRPRLRPTLGQVLEVGDDYGALGGLVSGQRTHLRLRRPRRGARARHRRGTDGLGGLPVGSPGGRAGRGREGHRLAAVGVRRRRTGCGTASSAAWFSRSRTRSVGAGRRPG